jgi:nitroreductase
MKIAKEFKHPITVQIQRRFSTRTYLNQAIDAQVQDQLRNFIANAEIGPLGTRCRFKVVAGIKGDRKTLRGLGTYGFIKNAAGFVIGSTTNFGKSLEDFGYLMECIILYATQLDLGTCWLGGSFNRSRFAKKISLLDDEIIPAVTSVGYIAPNPRRLDAYIRQEARSDQRRPWEWMFFDGEFKVPLTQDIAGAYAIPLEMVRLGPSASNRQPWRIIKAGDKYHFYLQRTPGYRESTSSKLLKIEDLQRVDMGIAMCHFELTADQQKLTGNWVVSDPGIPVPDEYTEYTVSWLT